jgi:hypothetical protein
MKPVSTLREAVERRLASHKPLGWVPSRRRQVEIREDVAILTLGWVASDGQAMIETLPDDPTLAQDWMITVDTSDLPEGVSVRSWSALPDTIDYIAIPTEDEIKAAAAMLGCRFVDRGETSDRIIYWMVK